MTLDTRHQDTRAPADFYLGQICVTCDVIREQGSIRKAIPYYSLDSRKVESWLRSKYTVHHGTRLDITSQIGLRIKIKDL